MSDIKLNISIKEEDNIVFKRCIRKLLDSTFIIGDKDEKLYSFIARESNRQDVSDYLRMIGFDVLVDANVRIAMLKPHEDDAEAVGLKRANVVTFTTEQYHLLLVLWEVYLENLGYSDENVVMRGDLIDKVKAYEVDIDSNKLAAAMKIFKKYDLVDYDPKDKSEDAIITLYPSLQFGWDVAQFQTVSAEYMKNNQIEDGLEVQNSGSDEDEEDVE
ncbi:DUF4194 domain-containing protein [Sutcliffiella horikoshii]|uniref:DUF4194 domain-containing protein n=1 Tax=Sutcliffiella horikoshii TaxID=79883 RepID=A0A5D4SWC7_9BACI|nr:DUF4194 domain-containing protein [Sutcliffiella horikoshii]TYS67680.1 DUF4194 domain-containing protein [Sutcliffiella horikoshii]